MGSNSQLGLAVCHADCASNLPLHVQACNTEAQTFYKRFGFEVKEAVPDYYKKLAEPDAVILSKVLRAVAVSA